MYLAIFLEPLFLKPFPGDFTVLHKGSAVFFFDPEVPFHVIMNLIFIGSSVF